MRLAQRTEEGSFLIGHHTLSVGDVIYPIEAQDAIDAFFEAHEAMQRSGRVLLDQSVRGADQSTADVRSSVLFARLQREQAACRAALAVFAVFGVIFPLRADYAAKRLRVANYPYPDAKNLLGRLLCRDAEKHNSYLLGEL